MKKVRCISPHGGAHHGFNGHGEPAAPGWTGPRQLPPNPGGYIDNGVLGRVAVGAVVDAPDDFEPDGYHFELADEPPPPARGGGLADLLSKGEN